MNIKTITFVCLICIFLSISFVSANDFNDTITITEQQNETILTETISNSEGTFEELNNEIQKGNELNLTKNYTYNTDTDNNLESGILISKNITINGNGFTINGNNSARALNIINSTILLNNIKFINCKAPNDEYGGAILCENTKLAIFNSSFINNTASRGSIIYFKNSNSTTILSEFINNIATNEGGLFYQDCDNSFINLSKFELNEANSGSSIAYYNKYKNNGSLVINNSNFTKMKANAIYLYYCRNSYISNLIFENNTSVFGSIDIRHSEFNKLINLTFKNNIAKDQGGAITIVTSNNNTISNSNFVNNTLYGKVDSVSITMGGAIFITTYSYDNNISNCTFENNAAYEGGAIFVGGICNIEHSKFINNTAEKGLSILFKKFLENLNNCTFINEPLNQQQCINNHSTYNMKNCIFINDPNCNSVESYLKPENIKIILETPYEIKISNYEEIGSYTKMSFTFNIETEAGAIVKKGKIKLKIGEETYTSSVSNGKVNFNEIPILKQLNTAYNCSVEYEVYKDLEHFYLQNIEQFTIIVKSRPQILLQGMLDFKMGVESNITTKIISDYEYYKNGNITITIQGKKYEMFKSDYIQKDDNLVSYTVYLPYTYIPSFSEIPEYMVINTLRRTHEITCNADEFHTKISSTIYVGWINPQILELNISKTEVICGETVYIDVYGHDILRPLDYAQVEYSTFSSDRSIAKLDENGKTRIKMTCYEEGINKCYVGSEKIQIIAKMPTDISQIPNYINQRGTNFELDINVNRWDCNKIASGFISIDINGKKYTSLVKEGKSKITIQTPYSPGTYSCKVTFNSDSQYVLNSSTTFIVTSKISTKVTVKSATGYQGKKVKLTAIVKDDAGNKIKKGIVIFKIKGKNYKAKIKNGKAKITIKYPKAKLFKTKSKRKNGYLIKTKYYKSVYNCKAEFNGYGNYFSSSSSFKVTSKKKPVTKKYIIVTSSSKKKTSHSKPKSNNVDADVILFQDYYTFWFNYNGHTLGNMPVKYKIYTGSQYDEYQSQTDSLGFVDISPIPKGTHKIYVEGHYLLDTKNYHSTFTVYRS